MYWSPEAEAEASEIFPGPKLGESIVIVIVAIVIVSRIHADCYCGAWWRFIDVGKHGMVAMVVTDQAHGTG